MMPSTRKIKAPVSLFWQKDNQSADSSDEGNNTEQQHPIDDAPEPSSTSPPRSQLGRGKTSRGHDDQPLDSNHKPAKMTKSHRQQLTTRTEEEPTTNLTYMEGITANEHRRNGKRAPCPTTESPTQKKPAISTGSDNTKNVVTTDNTPDQNTGKGSTFNLPTGNQKVVAKEVDVKKKAKLAK